MIKKASFEQWKELYELAGKIQKLEPWKYFWDMDLFAIEPKGYKEAVFLSIMGRGGTCVGVAAYEGLKGYSEFCELAQSENSFCPSEFFLGHQNSLVCYFGKRDELADYDEKVVNSLSLSFEEGKWPYFLSFQNRYYPYQLDSREAQVLIDVYKGLIFAIEEINEFDLNTDFEEEIYMVSMDDEGEWYSYIVPHPTPRPLYQSVRITNSNFLERLQNAQKCDLELAIDMDYLFKAAVIKDEEKPINPLVLIAYDLRTDQILVCEALEITEKEVDATMRTLFNVVDQLGKPNKIYVRNPLISLAIEDVCLELDIEVVEDPLEEVDDIIEGLKKNL